jgi:hypothetical protein
VVGEVEGKGLRGGRSLQQCCKLGQVNFKIDIMSKYIKSLLTMMLTGYKTEYYKFYFWFEDGVRRLKGWIGCVAFVTKV